MFYTNYIKIPYPFLHDAAMVISKRYNLRNIYMDKRGELCINIKGKLTVDEVKDILMNIDPNDNYKDAYEPDYNLQYSYSQDMQETHVYSFDGIDYRTL